MPKLSDWFLGYTVTFEAEDGETYTFGVYPCWQWPFVWLRGKAYFWAQKIWNA
jgi:hypothetical protein